MRRSLIATAVVLLAVASPAILYQQKQPSSPKDNGAQNLTTQGSPVTVVVNEPSTQNEKERPKDKPRKGPPIYSNWALVVVASIAAWAALRNIRELQKQSKATEDAANAAAETLNLMRDTTKRELRAYVLPTKAYRAQRQGTTWVVIEIKNCGSTPAYSTKDSWPPRFRREGTTEKKSLSRLKSR